MERDFLWLTAVNLLMGVMVAVIFGRVLAGAAEEWIVWLRRHGPHNLHFGSHLRLQK